MTKVQTLARQALDNLTLEEKASLLNGSDRWCTKAFPAKSIPVLRTVDGPHGVRYEDLDNMEANGGPSRKATLFPSEAALACGWDRELTEEIGRAIAREASALGVGIILGPGVNIKRSPLCGRNFEYYSEDPLLSGELASAFINGVQDMGLGACIKHFAVNNQESWRMSISAAVEERALFDIYLRAFELAIRKSPPATLMGSYNRVNGDYACESKALLLDILRHKFAYQGVIISDWGALNDKAASVAAGLALEMPNSRGATDHELIRKVRSGEVTQRQLDERCLELLELIFTYAEDVIKAQPFSYSEHHALSLRACEQCTVLLKNENSFLPLHKEEKVAVIGEMAKLPRLQGGGSSIVNPMQSESFLTAMKNEGLPFEFAMGWTGDAYDAVLADEAARLASAADKVLLFIGLPLAYECEGYDREHMRLPENQLRLLGALAATGKRIGVVLTCGSPVETPWLGKVEALITPYLGGETVNEALVRLLYGYSSPAGRLAETWPLRLEDTPCYHNFPGGPREVLYTESVFVGYRYYDTANIPVAFPFGYGLSYTTFEISGLTLDKRIYNEGELPKITITVKNTGGFDSAYTIQLYLKRLNSRAFQPDHELAGFTRVMLRAGEKKTVELSLEPEALGWYNPAAEKREAAGRYQLQAGHSSREIILCADFEIRGAETPPPPGYLADGAYGNIKDNSFPRSAFMRLYSQPLAGNDIPSRGEYNRSTPLGMMQTSFAGKCLLRYMQRRIAKSTNFSTDHQSNLKAAKNTAYELPLRNLPVKMGRKISLETIDALLSVLNGRGGYLQLLIRLLRDCGEI